MGDVIQLHPDGVPIVAGPFLEVELEGEPIPKERARVGKRGAYTPARTAAAEQLIAIRLKVALRGPRSRFAPLRVELEFYRGSKRKADLDNLAKLILDAANGIVWDDDSQIVQLVASRYDADNDPRTIIRVYRLDPDADL